MAAENIIAGSIVAGKLAAGSVETDKLVVGGVTYDKLSGGFPSGNLWPNPTSEAAPPDGADTSTAEWTHRYNAGGSARSGSYVRKLNNEKVGFFVPAAPGDVLYTEAYGRYASGSGSGRVGIAWCPTFGSLTSATYVYGSTVNLGIYVLSQAAAAGANAAPDGTNGAYIFIEATAASDFYFDSMAAYRMVGTDQILDRSIDTLKQATIVGGSSASGSGSYSRSTASFAAVTNMTKTITSSPGGRPAFVQLVGSGTTPGYIYTDCVTGSYLRLKQGGSVLITFRLSPGTVYPASAFSIVAAQAADTSYTYTVEAAGDGTTNSTYVQDCYLQVFEL
jgi:hypothetical protein